MKIKLLLFPALLLFIPALLNAQRPACGTTERVAQSLKDHPELIHEREQSEALASEWLKNHPAAKMNGGVIVIPTVVHVVYRTNAGNLTTARVQSQIDVLNEDFRRTNADAVNTLSVFQPFAADCEIEFCLAQQDPLGNATTGITYTQTTTSNIGSTNDYYTVRPAWNRNNYLNIWVCEIGGGILGFAYLPGTAPASYDGVVIDYHYFGRENGASAPYNLGRTCTHEVGHWLNLEHPSADDSNCNTDDGVDDTPRTLGETFDCDLTANTCVDSPIDYVDMVQNYMDYSEDNCLNIYTLGQKTRMHTAINSSRSGLLTSNGCLATANGVAEGPVELLMNPNPTTGVVNFAIGGAFRGNWELTVTDLRGVTLYHQELGLRQCQADLSALANGIYLVQTVVNGRPATNRLVIAH